MHIHVNQELAEDLGSTRTYHITGEQIQYDDLVLARPIDGQIQIARSEDGLLVTGRLETALTLDCHRCLRSYDHPLTIRLEANYTPDSLDYPIVDEDIDLAPLIREELILGIPPKQLCSVDCPGLINELGLAAEPIVRTPTVVTKESTSHHGSTKVTNDEEHQGSTP